MNFDYRYCATIALSVSGAIVLTLLPSYSCFDLPQANACAAVMPELSHTHESDQNPNQGQTFNQVITGSTSTIDKLPNGGVTSSSGDLRVTPPAANLTLASSAPISALSG